MDSRIVLILFCTLIVTGNLSAQLIIPLYNDSIPNTLPSDIKEITLNIDDQFGGYENISIPTLEIYLPGKEQSNRAAVIICPGGGYGMVNYLLEGINIAKAFVDHGIAAFVLKYRLPSDSIMTDKTIGPLQDAQQSIKLVRQQAHVWDIDGDKIGIMGFSAGGHLASSAGTHFDSCFISNPEHISLRPDFMILVYPVISMTDQLTHLDSRKNLLGVNPTAEKIEFLSNELHVSDYTPPTFLTHAGDDNGVVVENSLIFYEALRRHHIETEMHLYPRGGHGFVLSITTEEWMQPLFKWMETFQ